MSTMGTDGEAVDFAGDATVVAPVNGDGRVLSAEEAELESTDDATLEVAEPEESLADPGVTEPEFAAADPGDLLADPETGPAELEADPTVAVPEADSETGPAEPEADSMIAEPEADSMVAELETTPGSEGDSEPVETDNFEDARSVPDATPDPLITPPEMSQMLFVDVVLLLPATHPVVVLQEADPPYRELRIPVGGAEGIAIGYAARGLETPRPLTHELFTRTLEEFGMTLDVVRITEVRGSAFTAEMVISGRLGARVIDCRPSDGIALALRQRLPVPIMAAPIVLTRAGTDPAGAN